MPYSKQTWADGTTTPVTAARLNHMEDGIQSGDNVVVSASDPGLTVPGIWIQTGLGGDGTDFSIWFEDGT